VKKYLASKNTRHIFVEHSTTKKNFQKDLIIKNSLCIISTQHFNKTLLTTKTYDMKLTKNIIALQKGLVTPSNDGMDNRIAVATVQSHLMQWGYMLDQDAFTELSKSDLSFIENFNNEVITYLKDVMGGKHNFQPLYKNFPQEVMSKSDFELYFNAILHYWSNGTWEPSTVEYEKPIKFEKIKYTMIGYATPERFARIFTDLVSINQSLTPQDLAIVKWFASSGEKLVFPAQIPFKENLCTLAAMGIEGLPVKTPTDVLRIAVHLSGGDISLPKVPYKKVRLSRWSRTKSDNPERVKFMFKKFTRKERKYLLALLENTNCDPREMVLKDQRWVRLGEILHPAEYKAQYPKTALAFHKIRNEKVKSWYAQLNDAFRKDLESGLKVLSQRPGEFSRRIDWLVRTYPKDLVLIMNYLSEVLKGTSNKVLFEVYSHFEDRLEPKNNRYVQIKGARKKTQLPSLPALPGKLVEGIHRRLFETLKEKFATLPALGNCWIDEELRKIPLPTNMRSMNFSTKPKIRGQRIPLNNPDAKVVRPFVHWMDKNGSEDLDLSVTFVGRRTEVLNFHNLRVGQSIHSGDVRHRRGPCAEYIDIDMADAIANGFQYAVIDVRNFNGRGLKTVETRFGIMEREYPECNKTWLPETITSCQMLESESTNTLIAIIDLISKEYIMLDLDTDGVTYASGDVKNTLKMVEEYAKPPKVSVYDLVLLHVEARGKQVTLDDNVDTYFKYEDFSESYESTGKLMGV